MRKRLSFGIVAFLGLYALSGSASAQGAAPRPRPASRSSKASSAKSHVGLVYAKRLLDSDEPQDRIRAIARLGSIGSNEAVDAVADALSQASVSRDPRARLEAVRVLAGFPTRDTARQALLREATETGGEARAAHVPLASLVRGTAALALARGGDKKAVLGLLTVLTQSGPVGEAAARALRAYPPASIEVLLEGKKRLAPQLASFLGDLGDLRVIERLRAMLDDADPSVKTAAAVALAKLGDESALTSARGWLQSSEPRLRRASAEALFYLGAPEAGAAIAALLATEGSRDAGLALATLSGAKELAGPLGVALASAKAEKKPAIIAALGRISGPKAVAALAPLLADKDEELARHAALSLAHMPGEEARAALGKALVPGAAPATRRLLVRAMVVRELVQKDAPGGLRDALEAMAAARGASASEAADRAAGTFGLVATGAWSVERAVERACTKSGCAVDVVAAAARGALSRDEGAFEPLRRLLLDADLEKRDPLVMAAAAVSLLAEPDGGAITTSRLSTWAEGGGPLAPLAARALPSRDEPSIRGRIKRLLEGSDPVVRAHVALGLGRDPEVDAVSLLVNAYRYEDEPSVRRAIVRGLSRRKEVQRLATLALARDLDPDDAVRSLAKAALDGRVLDTPAFPPSGGAAPRRSVAFVTIASNDGKALPQDLRSGRLVRSDGLAVPVVADPDGAVLVPGLPAGISSLQLAPVAMPRDAR